VDPEMIQVAARFGFKVYYGDGTRLDVLRAAGLDKARLIAICIDNQDDCNRIVDLTKAEFPGTKIFARSYDRGHTLQLLARDVDYELRETFESAMKFGDKTLAAIGLDADRVDIVQEFIRTRDRDRIAVQQAEGIYAGIDMLRQRPKMAPFSEPQRAGRALNEEAEEIIEEKEEGEGEKANVRTKNQTDHHRRGRARPRLRPPPRATARYRLLRVRAWRGRRHGAPVHVRHRRGTGRARHCEPALPVPLHGAAEQAGRSAQDRACGGARRGHASAAAVAGPAARRGRQILRRPDDLAGASRSAARRSRRPRVPRIPAAPARAAFARARRASRRCENPDAVPAGYAR